MLDIITQISNYTTLNKDLYFKELKTSLKAVIKAGEKISEIYEQPHVDYQLKKDFSPLTQADRASQKIITRILSLTFPDITIISEENDNLGSNKNNCFWLVDPLDGTKSFLEKKDDFTINIALIKNGRPVLAIIHLPVKKETYFATIGSQSYKFKQKIEPIRVSNKTQKKEISAVISRHHSNPELINCLKKLGISNYQSIGGATKGCLLAEGKTEVYLRLTPFHQWDVAAMDLIIQQSGGTITLLNGIEICYLPNRNIIPGILATNGLIHQQLLTNLK